MRESRAWQYINEGRPSWLAIERLEPMYPPGLPDTFWTDMRPTMSLVGEPLKPLGKIPGVHNRSGWLELKYCEADDKEYRAGRIPKLRPSQPQFLRRQASHGVPGGVLLRVGTFHWLLWPGKAEHSWVKMMCSTEAIANAVHVEVPREGLTAVAQLNYFLTFDTLQR